MERWKDESFEKICLYFYATYGTWEKGSISHRNKIVVGEDWGGGGGGGCCTRWGRKCSVKI